MSNEIWEEIYNRLEYFTNTHNTMLVFVNTRRLAERVTKHLAERLDSKNDKDDAENVMAHHGSMAKEKC